MNPNEQAIKIQMRKIIQKNRIPANPNDVIDDLYNFFLSLNENLGTMRVTVVEMPEGDSNAREV